MHTVLRAAWCLHQHISSLVAVHRRNIHNTVGRPHHAAFAAKTARRRCRGDEAGNVSKCTTLSQTIYITE